MLSLEEAQEQKFATSTRAELRQYATQLGIEDIPDNASSDTLKKRIFAALGLATSSSGPAMPEVKSVGGSDKIFPSYNLTPNGIWGGRRHRLSIPRPEGVKIGQAEGYSWNGKHQFYIAYDEVTSVPEPIFQILVTNKRRRPVQKFIPVGNGMNEQTTAWEFDSLPMTYVGLDEEFKDCAGSLMEWYQSRGSAFFDGLSLRQMTLIAAKVEVPIAQHIGPNIAPRVFDEKEMRERLKEFFFGFADADAEANEAIRA